MARGTPGSATQIWLFRMKPKVFSTFGSVLGATQIPNKTPCVLLWLFGQRILSLQLGHGAQSSRIPMKSGCRVCFIKQICSFPHTHEKGKTTCSSTGGSLQPYSHHSRRINFRGVVSRRRRGADRRSAAAMAVGHRHHAVGLHLAGREAEPRRREAAQSGPDL